MHAARHASGRRVVVKRLRDTLALDARLAARFCDEGRVSRRVCHSNVVRVFDHGVSADGTPLPLTRVRGLVAQLLAGLAAIHAAGIVHADIKSSNVIVDVVGGADHLTIIDFGLARTRTSREVADDGLVVGTPAYMAPEVLRGEPPTVRADVYSAAIVAFELLAGAPPLGADAPLDVLERRPAADLALPAGARALIPAELEGVLRRALAEDPLRRFPDARGFAIAFERAAGALGPAAPAGERKTEGVRRHRREVFDVIDGGSPDPVIVAYLDSPINDNSPPHRASKCQHGAPPSQGCATERSSSTSTLA